MKDIDMMQDIRVEKVLAECRRIMELAHSKYGVKLEPKISFDLRGTTAGMAGYKRNSLTGEFTTRLRFNIDMITGNSFDAIYTNTIPHEIAHLVCYANPHLGKNHNIGWKRVCRALGGNGVRCHSESVHFAKGNTWQYTGNLGTKITISDVRHRKIQNGTRFIGRKTGEVFDRNCDVVLLNAAKNSRPVTPPSVTPKVREGVGSRKSAPTRTSAVRQWIKDMIAAGRNQFWCENNCGLVFGIPHSQGRSYVKTQWVRAHMV